MLWRLAPALLLAFLPQPVPEPGSSGLPVLWTAQTHTFLESAPTLADLDGDGWDEVLLAAREEMIALDGRGRELWRRRTTGRYFTYPAALVRQGEPTLVVAADGGGLLTCLDGRGQVVWSRRLKGGASWCAPVLADLRHDGRWSVVQGDETGCVSVLGLTDGSVRWTASVKGSAVSPAVGDLDGDGLDEIAVATSAGALVVLDAAGNTRWERPVGGPSQTWATSAPILFRAGGGAVRIAVGANEGRVMCFAADGTPLWAQDTLGAVAASLSVGDIERDGRADVVAVTQTGMIYSFDEDGRERRRIDMQGRTIAACALVDLDNDGAVEIVVCTQSGRLMAFDSDGSLVRQHVFDNRTINMTPTFGRVAASPERLALVVSGGESGRVVCLQTPARLATPDEALQWPAYRHDARKTGAWFDLRPARSTEGAPSRRAGQDATPASEGIAPRGAEWAHVLSGAPILFDVRVAEGTPLPLTASASCVRPDGSLQAVVTHVLGVRGEIPLSVDVAMPGVYRFAWSVSDADGHQIAAGGQDVDLEPMSNERALVEQAVTALRSAAERAGEALPLSASALRREAAALAAAPEPQGATVWSQRIAEARRAIDLAAAVESASRLGQGTSVVAFESATWDSVGVDRSMPASVAGPLILSRRVVPGEHEPISVKLLNITDRPLQVRVTAEVADAGPAVRLMRSVEAPTSRGGMAWDPLVDLDDPGVLTIPSLACREVWVDAQFDGVRPGRHLVRLRAQALNGAGVLEGPTGPRDVPAPEALVEVAFRVLPFAPAPTGAFRMCCWATCGPAEVRDLLAHGNNVFCVPQPEPRYDRQGRLGGFDYAKLDTMLSLLRGHDIVALVQGMPALKPHIGTPQYASELKRYLGDLKVHMRGFGIDTAHFALYPIDEPGGAGWNAIHAYSRFGRLVRAAAPDVRLYVNGGAEMPMIREIAPYVDIWCPGLSQLAETSAELAAIRATKKELWSYDCGYRYTTAIRSTLKDTLIVPEYRTSALFAARHGGKGIGFWCYNIGPNAWTRVENDYPIVYPGSSGPVTSRRWEAVREGIEDVRVLLALRGVMRTTKNAALRARLGRLLDTALPALVDRSHREVTIGLGRSAFAASLNETTLAAFRGEMLDCVEAVCAARR